MPFREAHGVVAGLVRTALENGRRLSELQPAELAAHHPALGEHAAEYRQVLTREAWLESKVSEGGTASVRVREQLRLAHEVLVHPRAAGEAVSCGRGGGAGGGGGPRGPRRGGGG